MITNYKTRRGRNEVNRNFAANFNKNKRSNVKDVILGQIGLFYLVGKDRKKMADGGEKKTCHKQ